MTSNDPLARVFGPGEPITSSARVSPRAQPHPPLNHTFKKTLCQFLQVEGTDKYQIAESY